MPRMARPRIENYHNDIFEQDRQCLPSQVNRAEKLARHGHIPGMARIVRDGATENAVHKSEEGRINRNFLHPKNAARCKREMKLLKGNLNRLRKLKESSNKLS